MTNESDLSRLQDLLLAIASGEEVDPVMQVPALHSLLLALEIDSELNDQDCNLILGIDSELREFPFDPGFRSRCHPEFLERKDQELVELKVFYRDQLRHSCESLYQRIKSKSTR